MPSFSTNEVLLVRYSYTDLSSAKIRPAVVVANFANSLDYVMVPLTSRTHRLAQGEFVLSDWNAAGLHVATVVKRGIYTIHTSLILKTIGHLTAPDASELEKSLRIWLQLP